MINPYTLSQPRQVTRHSLKKPWRIATAAAFLALPLAALSATSSTVFQADLMPLNASVGGGATGTVTLTVDGDKLTIDANAKGLHPPGMHMIHIHGFTTGNKGATCAGPAQDRNADGVIDLRETEPVSGTTLIPFTNDPAGLKVPSKQYPVADAQGEFTYKETVSLKKLNAMLKKDFSIHGVQLGKRVIYVHGVPDTPPLPITAASLPGVPAAMTLPVACGVIRVVK